MANTALDHEMQDVVRCVERAMETIQREEWPTAEQALVEAQDRIGRLLREIELKRNSEALATPPSPIKGNLG